MKYLTNKETAEFLKVHPVTLAQWRRKGIGPAYSKCGSDRFSRVRYNERDIRSWLKANRTDVKAGA